MNMDNEEVRLLVMFDMGGTFVTINHSILIDILKNDFASVVYIMPSQIEDNVLLLSDVSPLNLWFLL